MSNVTNAVASAADFRFETGEDLSDLGGAASRFNHNVAAIKVLKRLEAEAREPGALAPEEQRILSRYTGWGDSDVLGRAFPYGAYSHSRPCRELDGLLTPDEIRRMLASSLNAHYTALPIIRAIYAALDHYGLTPRNEGRMLEIGDGQSVAVASSPRSKLRILEPAAGVGHFLGAMPPALAANSDRVAVEIDSLTGRILQRLYPQTRVFVRPFEDTALPNDYFDLVISNVPFGAFAVADPSIRESFLKAAIHDYYFVRAVRLARPGGVIAFITSRYTLDKKSPKVRRHLATHAELLAAARLPRNAFRANAGTEVITDVLILRKRDQPLMDARADWVETGVSNLTNDAGEEREITINGFYIEHPELMLGRPCFGRGMHERDEFILKEDGRDLARSLAVALSRQLPADGYRAHSVQLQNEVSDVSSDREEFLNTTGLDLLSGRDRACADELLEIYVAAKEVIRSQMRDASDEELAEKQRELSRLYDRFRMRYSYIDKNLKKLSPHSPVVPFLRALEVQTGKHSYKRAALFSQRTIRPARRRADSYEPKEALLVSLNDRGRVDPDYIAELCRRPFAEVLPALDGLVFETNGGAFVTAEEYLSGDIRQKLRDAEAVTQFNPAFEKNVAALRSLLPPDLGRDEISVRLGSSWVPEEIVRDFIITLVPSFKGTVKYIPALAVWKIEGVSPEDRSSIEATRTWGTKRVNVFEIAEDILNLRTTSVTDEVPEPGGGTKIVVNDNETIAAQAKQIEIKQKFASWVWIEEGRTATLVRIYNERFNSFRKRECDGSHLLLPGMNSKITLYPHQRHAIWRIMTNKATLLAHCVGAGKAQPLTAKILTPRDWKTMGEIQTGDEVIASDGSVTKVVGVYPQGVKSIYRVTFSDGSSTECCKEHLWRTQTYKEREYYRHRQLKNKERFAGKIRTLEEIKESLLARNRIKNHRIPLVGPVAFAQQPVPLDPYLLGVIIGDGCCRATVRISTGDQEIIEECRKKLPPLTEIKHIPSSKYEYSVNRVVGRGLGKHNPVMDALREMNLYGKLSYDKFVPEIYKFNSPEIRLSVLQGLMDTDGTVEKLRRGTSFATASEQLAQDVIFLVRSFGGTATHRTKRPRVRYNGVIKEGTISHVIHVSLPPQINPFRLSRKASKVRPKTKYPPARYITGIEYVGEKEAQCIAVAHPDHLYVTDDFIVTHNTYSMIAAAMELRRLGLCHKSLIVVPNHLPAQWAAEAIRLYPNIKLLAPGKEHLTSSQRGELLSRIATSDYDVIIIPQTAFKMLPLDPAKVRDHIQREIDTLTAYLEEMEATNGKRSRSVKELQKAIKRLEARLASTNQAIKRVSRDTITWDELGIDVLMIDEFHYYKNLYCPTKMTRVAGMPSVDSQRAFDCFLKVRSVLENGGRVVCATATPVSNTMAEVYVCMKYLQLETLQELGIDHFDAWVQQFAETTQSLEITPDGASYRFNTRFNKFTNIPELSKIWQQVLDVKSAAELNLPRPRLKGGKPQIVSVPASEELKAYTKELAKRVEEIKARRVPPYVDNMLRVTGDGRKAALDIRLVGPNAPRPAQSKVGALVDNIMKVYHETVRDRGVQLVFLDLSTPRRGK